MSKEFYLSDQVNIKMQLVRAVGRYQKRLQPVCQLCGASGYLQMHHILSRGYVPKRLLNEIPLPFHSLLCEKCHLYGAMGSIDSYEMRHKLLAINMKVFGVLRLESAFRQLNELLPNGIRDDIINIEAVKKQYDEIK